MRLAGNPGTFDIDSNVACVAYIIDRRHDGHGTGFSWILGTDGASHIPPDLTARFTVQLVGSADACSTNKLL